MNVKKLFTKPICITLFACFCTLLWGSAYPCIKRGYEVFALAENDISGKLVFAGIRFGLAGVVTLIFFRLSGQKLKKPNKSQLGAIAVIMLIQTVIQYICFYVGLSNTTGVKGSILNSSVTFFSVILSHIFMKNDKLNPRKIIGCIVGFTGIIIINVYGATDIGTLSLNFMGDGMVILAALAFSIGALVAKIYSDDFSPVLITGYQMSVGGLVLVIIGVLTGGRLNRVNATGVILLAYMILLSAVAYTLWTVLNKYNNMSTVAIYNFMTPVFGTILSAIFLGENLFETENLLALIFVCAGICIVNLRNKSVDK